MLFISSFLYLKIYGLKIRWQFYFLILIAIIWIILIYYKFNISIEDYDSNYTYLGFLVNIGVAYFLIISINEFFEKAIKIVYYLAIVSLIGFTLQLIIPSVIFKLNSLFTIAFPFFIMGMMHTQILFYSHFI